MRQRSVEDGGYKGAAGSLYRDMPTVENRGGRRAPVGTIIFDSDAEYFWPDD